MHHRIPTFLVAAIIAASGMLAIGHTPASASPGLGKKVAIIVGPVGAATDSFRRQADQTASAAAATGATVVKVYSPNATWANVKAAVNGAHIVVYLGHGNGFPNPYSTTQSTDRVNGWGLNTSTTNGDADSWSNGTLVYCGEKALLGTLTSSDGWAQREYCGGNNGTQGISPAPGFVMVYAGACYSPGASESWDPVPSHNVALQRVSNYSRPPLRLGASASFATYHGAATLVDRILRNPTMSFGEIYHAGRPSGTFTDDAHLTEPGARAWMARTSMSTVYTYAFAGDPARTPDGGPPPPAAASPTVERQAGPDRYAAAASMSAAHFAPGVPVAYVATGQNFPDALAGGPVAALNRGPVLLVTRDALPAATATELSRVKPQRIVVLGGVNSVSDEVANALKVYTPGTVTRLSGADRYAAAAAISASHFKPGVPLAYVATGLNFPDALAGVPPAGMGGAPILLVATDTIPPATASELTRLKAGRLVILGGASSVSSDVAAALGAFTTGTVTRLAGTDRYAAAAAISNASFPTASTVYISTGRNFPDALAGGPIGALTQGPMLLVPPTSLPQVVRDELLRLKPSRIVVLGGTRSVSEEVVDQIRAIFP